MPLTFTLLKGPFKLFCFACKHVEVGSDPSVSPLQIFLIPLYSLTLFQKQYPLP